MENQNPPVNQENNAPVVNTTVEAKQTVEATAPVAAKDHSETLTIKRVSEIMDGGKKMFVVHTSPSAINKPKAGEKESRFKMDAQVFENAGKSQGKPIEIFKRQIVGGKFIRVTRAVKAGDAWITGKGNGTYTKDQMARVSETFEVSALAEQELNQAVYSSYANSLFAGANLQSKTTAIVGGGTPEGAEYTA